jgi:hypothetical protein
MYPQGHGGGGLPSFISQLFKALLHLLEGLLKNIPRVYGLHVNCLLKFLANMITYYLILGSTGPLRALPFLTTNAQPSVPIS